MLARKLALLELVRLGGDVVSRWTLVVAPCPGRDASVALLELSVVVVGDAGEDLEHVRSDLRGTGVDDRVDDLDVDQPLPGLGQLAGPVGAFLIVGLLVPFGPLAFDSSDLMLQLL